MPQDQIIIHFQKDHDMLEEMNKKYSRCKSEDSPECSNVYTEMRNALLRHFREEEVMYAKYHVLKGETAEILKIVREQHKEIWSLLQLAHQCKAGPLHDVRMLQFADLLMQHRLIEEKYLYPEIDKQLSVKEKNNIIENIEHTKIQMKH